MSELDRAVEQIVSLLESGRPEEASRAALQARTRFERESEPARLHGIALLSSGDFEAAIGALVDARERAPRSVEVLCNLASAHLANADVDTAIDILEHARSLSSDHPGVLNGLGNAHAAAGALLISRDAYAAATRAAPGYLGAWINLAGAEIALENAPEAERILRMILTRTDHPEVRLLLGNALVAQKHPAEAEREFAAGLRLAPNDARFPYQLGLIADEQKDIDQASAAFERALHLEPSMASALAQLVFVKRQRCDWNDLDRLSARLREAVATQAEGISPFGFLAEAATPAEQLRCA
ncbi:MAG: tetratricopeptide repeat protein, partial [Dokdonella sp.]